MLYLLCMLILIYILVRNTWVYKQRINLIDNRWDEYNNFLSYDGMMKKFWVWDIEKLRKDRL